MIEDAVDILLTAQAEAARRGVLTMWTIYDKPADHPDGFIARRFDVARGRSGPTEYALTGTLAGLRSLFLQAGLTVIPRHEKDDKPIVETWL